MLEEAEVPGMCQTPPELPDHTVSLTHRVSLLWLLGVLAFSFQRNPTHSVLCTVLRMQNCSYFRDVCSSRSCLWVCLSSSPVCSTKVLLFLQKLLTQQLKSRSRGCATPA